MIFRFIKKRLYFLVANYFVFWAKIRLKKWHPRIIVVTGSNGKTSTMHLLKSQLKSTAKYSERANSAFGIPFDILGIRRQSFGLDEWPLMILLAPFSAFKSPFAEKIYVAEADAERPGEGQELSALLKPEATIWLTCDRTHSQNFDSLVAGGKFQNIDEAIADEFGYYLEHTEKFCLVNSNNGLIKQQVKRTAAKVSEISQTNLKNYSLGIDGTRFSFTNKVVFVRALLPREFHYSISAVLELLKYLNVTPDYSFENFELPPGRSSILDGIKKTRIIDSSYNANFASVKAILLMFAEMKDKEKWIVLGDLTDQGKEEKEEHQKLAELLNEQEFEQLIFVGPRLSRYAKPILKKPAQSFENPKEALDYLRQNLKGGEVILFKGARFLEGIIEHLLLNKADVRLLCRQEVVWRNRRKKWQL